MSNLITSKPTNNNDVVGKSVDSLIFDKGASSKRDSNETTFDNWLKKSSSSSAAKPGVNKNKEKSSAVRNQTEKSARKNSTEKVKQSVNSGSSKKVQDKERDKSSLELKGEKETSLELQLAEELGLDAVVETDLTVKIVESEISIEVVEDTTDEVSVTEIVVEEEVVSIDGAVVAIEASQEIQEEQLIVKEELVGDEEDFGEELSQGKQLDSHISDKLEEEIGFEDSSEVIAVASNGNTPSVVKEEVRQESIREDSIATLTDNEGNQSVLNEEEQVRLNAAFATLTGGRSKQVDGGNVSMQTRAAPANITHEQVAEAGLEQSSSAAKSQTKLAELASKLGLSNVETSEMLVKGERNSDQAFRATMATTSHYILAEDGVSTYSAELFSSIEDLHFSKANDNQQVELGAEVDLEVAVTDLEDSSGQFGGGSHKNPGSKTSAMILSHGGEIIENANNKEMTVNFAERAVQKADNTPQPKEQLNMTLKHAISTGKSEIKLNLYPRALGAVEVTVEVTKNVNTGQNVVSKIKIVAENKAALEILEKSQAELTKSLSEVKESKDASLSFDMKEREEAGQNAMHYSDSEEREKWMNKFVDVSDIDGSGEVGGSDLADQALSPADQGRHANGNLNIEV